MKVAPFSPPQKRPAAFTLIEVTLAVGITSLALIALLAMVPQGIQTLKIATDRAIEARIHQQVVSEVALTDWLKRDKYDNTVRFYDDQGIQLVDNDSDNFNDDSNFDTFEEKIVYAARIHVPQRGEQLPDRLTQDSGGTSSYSPVDFSGDPGDDNELQLILVEISSSPNVREPEDFDDETNWRNIHTYQSTLTRMIDTQSLVNAAAAGTP